MCDLSSLVFCLWVNVCFVFDFWRMALIKEDSGKFWFIWFRRVQWNKTTMCWYSSDLAGFNGIKLPCAGIHLEFHLVHILSPFWQFLNACANYHLNALYNALYIFQPVLVRKRCLPARADSGCPTAFDFWQPPAPNSSGRDADADWDTPNGGICHDKDEFEGKIRSGMGFTNI